MTLVVDLEEGATRVDGPARTLLVIGGDTRCLPRDTSRGVATLFGEASEVCVTVTGAVHADAVSGLVALLQPHAARISSVDTSMMSGASHLDFFARIYQHRPVRCSLEKWVLVVTSNVEEEAVALRVRDTARFPALKSVCCATSASARHSSCVRMALGAIASAGREPARPLARDPHVDSIMRSVQVRQRDDDDGGDY